MPAEERRGGSTAGAVIKFLLGAVCLLCCGPFGIFALVTETVYALRMDAPKYSARPLPVEQRPVEAIEPMQVFLDMRDAGGRSLSQRKESWRVKYEGRWVSWKGLVEETRLYETLPSELNLRPLEGQEFKVQVFLDPLHNEQLKQLRKGQEVRVSGMLWGYYFVPDTARLADGALVDMDVDVPARVQDGPQ